MAFARVPLLLALLHAAVAEQPSAPSPITAPLRELPWGQLNFLHTTDTHGWHGGHLQEAQYSGDWGDYISFAHHLHDRADADGSDLLLIDTGDRVEGNGLYDASDPKGAYALDIINQQRIDVMCVGNHELYQSNTTIREFQQVVPDFKDSYIASNLDVINPKDGRQTQLAPRFRKFTTKNQGIRIVAFGFLFNFKGNANNSVVQPVEDTIQEQWFKDAIKDKEVDLFLVAGHVPVRGGVEFEAIYKAIRTENWDTPIAFFGGHTHIRDYRKFEKKAWGLESGRYMETLGFLSVSGLRAGGKKDSVVTEASPEFKRLYIDNNRFSLYHHSGTNESTFDTELGRHTSVAISEARKALKLDHHFGCAPQNYWLNRAPYPANNSLLTWLQQEVLPDTFSGRKSPAIVITNSGALRFDIFKGPFTIDSTFLVSPFTSGFKAFKDVPYNIASQILSLLNNEGPILLRDLEALGGVGQSMDALLPPFLPERIDTQAHGDHRLHANDWDQTLLGEDGTSEQPQVPGYTTSDDAGKDGDDTIHQAIQFYDVPNCISSNASFPPIEYAPTYTPWEHPPFHIEIPKKVDVIYNEFLEDYIALALRYLGEKRDVGEAEYVLDKKSLTDVLSDWIQGSSKWSCSDRD